MKKTLSILLTICSFIVQAQPIQVKELPAYNKSINPVTATYVYNNKYLYVLATRVNDTLKNELWISDGTGAGTQLLKSVAGEIIGSGPVNNQFIFLTGIYAANGNDMAFDIWKTDGSPNGTQLVKQQVAVDRNNLMFNTRRPRNFTVVNNQLFFIANGGTNFQQLWKTDGTSNGTVAVKTDFVFIDSYESITYLKALNNQLLFVQTAEGTTSNHSILFTSDGTYAGTKEILSNSNFYFTNVNLGLAINYNGKLIFTAFDPAHGNEPWITDGTTNGTSILMDAYPGPGSSFIQRFALTGDKVFTMEGPGQEQVIAIYDLTNNVRTVLSQTFNNIYETSLLNNKLFFKAISKEKGTEWFTSDGSVAGTHVLKDVREGPFGALDTWGNQTAGLSVNNGYFFFTANDGIHGTELWYYDNATNNTSLYTDIAAGAAWSIPDFFRKVGDQLFFTAYDKNKFQLYRIDLNNIRPLASNYKPMADGEWLHSFGPEPTIQLGHYNLVEGICTDSKGNVYIPGRFAGRTNNFVFFDSDTIAAGNPNYESAYKDYLVKLGPDGQFKWFRNNGGAAFFDNVAVAVDNNDDVVYAAGATGRAVFGNQVINHDGMYVCKYDSLGNLLWYRLYVAGQFSKIHHVITNTTNEIIFGGTYRSGFIDLGNGISQTSLYTGQYFVAKTNAKGDPQWVINLPNHVGFEGYIKKIIQDKLGNSYVLTTQFAPNTVAQGCLRDTTFIQISKLSDNGRLLWNKKFTCVGLINALSLNIDAAGLLNTSGYYYGEAFIDGYRIGYNSTSTGCQDIEIIQVTLRTNDGKVTGLGRSAYTNLSVLDIKANKDGSYYLLGHQINSNITSKLPGFEISPYVPATDQLVLQHRLYDGKILGEKKWTLNANITSTYFNRSYFTLDRQNNFILTTSGGPWFDTIPNGIANYNINGIVWKHINHFSTPQITTLNNRSEIKVINNPSSNNIILSLPGTGITGEVNVYNASGQLVIRKKINASLTIINIEVSSLARGIYFVKVQGFDAVKFLKR